jgi:nitroreductase
MAYTTSEWSAQDVAACVSSVMRARRSVRAFKPQPLQRDLVRAILEDAAAAPSGANIQPWRVHAVSGAVKDELASAIVDAFRAGKASAPAHFPDPLPDVFHTRLLDFGRGTTGRWASIATTPRRACARPSRTFHSSARRSASSSASTAG